MRVPQMRPWLPIAVPALALGLLLLLLLLAGCASGGGDVQITPVASRAATVSATLTLAPTATTPTASGTTTPGAQQGAAEFCAQPASAPAQLPASVPAYPDADLRIGQSSGGYGLYGLCTRADVATVATYYAGQLPARGWQQLQTTSIAAVRQLSATQGSAQVTVTIQPDAQLAGTTDIIIQTTGL
jgi:hypothetical protein